MICDPRTVEIVDLTFAKANEKRRGDGEWIDGDKILGRVGGQAFAQGTVGALTR